jgi:hypothetical protein
VTRRCWARTSSPIVTFGNAPWLTGEACCSASSTAVAELPRKDDEVLVWIERHPLTYEALHVLVGPRVHVGKEDRVVLGRTERAERPVGELRAREGDGRLEREVAQFEDLVGAVDVAGVVGVFGERYPRLASGGGSTPHGLRA